MVTEYGPILTVSAIRYLIDIAQETVRIQVVADSVFVALEMSRKPDQSVPEGSSISGYPPRSTGRPSDSGAVRESVRGAPAGKYCLPLHHALCWLVAKLHLLYKRRY